MQLTGRKLWDQTRGPNFSNEALQIALDQALQNQKRHAGQVPYVVHNVCSEIKGEKVFLMRHEGLLQIIYKAE